jgi:hypothetical protein
MLADGSRRAVCFARQKTASSREGTMSGHGHIDASNKNVALLISVLAVVLAFSETLGKSAQTIGLDSNIEAANLWAFYQAKTIRMTTLRAATESFEAELAHIPATAKPEYEKRIAAWKKDTARYDSEPETGEGRKELVGRAKAAESKRNLALASYHHYEVASALIQIAIVLASAEVITGVAALVWISGFLGLTGIAFCFIGYFWPTAVHLF